MKTNEHGVIEMCEAMEKLVNDGVEKGRIEGRTESEQNTILRLWRKGKSLADIMDATDWTGERINAFLRSRNLQPAQYSYQLTPIGATTSWLLPILSSTKPLIFGLFHT